MLGATFLRKPHTPLSFRVFIAKFCKAPSPIETHDVYHKLKTTPLIMHRDTGTLAHRRGGSLRVRGQPCLQMELQDSEGYAERPCLEEGGGGGGGGQGDSSAFQHC